MPNARVGMMPNPSGQSTSKRRGRRKDESTGGRKGITIEDLKSQTAERLAKQHQSRQRKHIRTSHPTNLQPKISYDRGANAKTRPPALEPTSNLTHTHAPVRISHSHSFQYSTSFESEFSPENSQASCDLSPHSHNAPTTPTHNISHSSMSMHHRQSDLQKNNNEQNISSRKPQKRASPYVPLKVQRVPTAKLPQTLSHGLTVQELKEMTRARLASEATEDSGTGTGTETVSVNDADQHLQHNLNRQRVYSHDNVRNEVNRQRFNSCDSLRSAPSSSYAGHQSSSNFRNPFGKSRNGSSSRLNHMNGNHPVISTHGSMDAADNGSVNSYASGLGTESQSQVGSEASGVYTSMSMSSRDLGRCATFPMGETNGHVHGETDKDQYGHFMTSTSFESGTRRHALNGLTSPALSNLMEDKPFHNSEIGTSFSGEGMHMRFDFGALPASPAVHTTAFSEEALCDLLHSKRPATPLTAQSLAFSDSHATHDEITVPLPDLPIPMEGHLKLSRKVSTSGELPNSVAESVLGSQEENTSPWKISNPWKESNSNNRDFAKLTTDVNKLLLSESSSNPVSKFPFSSFRSKSVSVADKESDWTPFKETALTPKSVSMSNTVVPEHFDDDGIDVLTSPAPTENEPNTASPAKSVNKRSTSRWKFM